MLTRPILLVFLTATLLALLWPLIRRAFGSSASNHRPSLDA